MSLPDERRFLAISFVIGYDIFRFSLFHAMSLARKDSMALRNFLAIHMYCGSEVASLYPVKFMQLSMHTKFAQQILLQT